jgi:hypothetical protein
MCAQTADHAAKLSYHATAPCCSGTTTSEAMLLQAVVNTQRKAIKMQLSSSYYLLHTQHAVDVNTER